MRVFCAVRHSADPGKYYGALWSGNFYPALRGLGHEVVESRVDLLPASGFMHIGSDFTAEEKMLRSRITQDILEEVVTAHRRKPIDLFLSYFYNAHFDPAGFDELRHLGILSVNFYCNSIYQFDLVARIAAKADFSWHPEKSARDSYLKVGARPVWVQMGADPTVYQPIQKVTRKRGACFVGQRYADRDRWMAALIRAEIPVDIFGSGWMPEVPNSPSEEPTGSSEYLGRPVRAAGTAASYRAVVRDLISKDGLFAAVLRAAQMMFYRRATRQLLPLFFAHAKGMAPSIADIVSAYEVCLNFSNVWADGRPGSALIPHVRLRDFEAPMCRTCYLTGYTEEISEFYDLGTEIETYSSPQELIEKTRFYLDHPQAAERLRAAGYARALKDHTWVRRFDELFSKIGLSRGTSSASLPHV